MAGHPICPRTLIWPRRLCARSRSDRRIRSRRRVAAYDGARDSACRPPVQPPPLRPSAADERDILSESFGGSGLLEQLNSSARVVGQRKDLVEIDLWLHAVALDDALEPRPGVERLGVLDAIPLVHAARPAAFGPNQPVPSTS